MAEEKDRDLPVDDEQSSAGDAAASDDAAETPKEKKKRYPRSGFQRDGKHILNARKKIDAFKRYPLEEALDLLEASAPKRKFDETIELVMKLGVDPRKQGQSLRGSYSLPRGVGKTNRVICFAEGPLAEEARAAGASVVGAEELAKKIEEGWDDFDVAVAHPATMKYVGRLGKVLGPKGKMPTPKAGTVTPDVATAVKEFAAGKIEYRTDDRGNVHVPVGKRSFKKEALVENINAFISLIVSLKPVDSKGIYIQKIVVSSTMGPGVGVATP